MWGCRCGGCMRTLYVGAVCEPCMWGVDVGLHVQYV